jgi:hypothetical protein
MAQRKRRWRKVLVWVAAVVAVLVGLLVVAVAITPTLVRSQIADAVGDYWDGRLEIGPMHLGMSSPLRVEELRLVDSHGKTWVEVGSVSLHLRDWPGLHPVLEEVDVEDVALTAHFAEGLCRIPLTLPEGPSEPSGYVELRRASVRNVTLQAEREGAAAWGGFEWSSESDAGVTTTRQMPTVWPLALHEFVINEVSYAKDALEIRSFRTTPEVTGHVRGLFRIKQTPSQPAQIRATVSIEALPLASLTDGVTEEGKPRPGILTARYVFRARGEERIGRGAIVLADADLWRVPVLSDLLRVVNPSSDGLALSDVRAEFATSGTLVTLRRLELANALSAFRAQPGGTIDLDSGATDLHVVTAPLKHVSDALARVPVANLLVDLGGKLTRLHVTGRWDIEDGIRVGKEPLDVLEGTAEFFVGVAKTGGDFGKGLGKSLEQLTDTLK